MRLIKVVGIAIIMMLLSSCLSLKQKRYEWPEVHRKDNLVVHKYYALTYNEDHEIANWAAYSLTKKETHPIVDRSYYYATDPGVETQTATKNDYNGSGYDRGHLIPARDMAFNQTAQDEVNYMSNITPQNRGFNRGIWRTLEARVRKWSVQYDSVMVVTGPLTDSIIDTIGKENTVSVPAAFYKTLLVRNDTLNSAVAFVIPNEKASGKSHLDFAITVDSLETLTGYDFFPLLPRKLENNIESKIDTAFWDLY
ncbi:MAG TPA: DNA/RNA non-specific endonuclease [Bacteroidales bacterium]|nr:DNA/RNA non-specific endonuclease [Bacteroidales bacterium]